MVEVAGNDVLKEGELDEHPVSKRAKIVAMVRDIGYMA